MSLSVAWPRLFLVALPLTAMLALSATAEAQTAPDPVFTVATSTVLDPPHPVLGTDGRRHLVYEVRIVNTSPLRVRFDRVVVRGASSARTFKAVAGRAIAGIMSTPLRAATTTLGPAQAGVLWLDVVLRRATRVPRRLVHRFVTTVSGRRFPARVFAWRGAGTKVARRGPVVISPPLRGSGYYDANGCCGTGPHTRALLSIGGLPFLAQRFAVDWVRFDALGRWMVGDPTKNENYVVFGDPIYAVAPGRVVSVLGTLPENTPPTPLANLTPRTALGNHVVEDLGGGRFALYAHMQPGSVPPGVRVGSMLRRGEVIGRVGNTGSSTAPHLHFHITDGPLAVGSQGRPYVFNRFNFTRVVTNPGAVEKNGPGQFRPAPAPVQRDRQLPLTGDVVDFP